MTLECFASFEALLGQRTVEVDGVYWSRVRPFFFRPLLPFEEFSAGTVRPPQSALLGGFQYAVPSCSQANSFLSLRIFENTRNYSIDALDYNRKRQVKKAAKEFEIRPITNVSEFKTSAYPLYLSFYERTRYEYGSKRKQQDYFNRWSDALFDLPDVTILGGYRKGLLGGVSLSMLINNTLFYATFFCDANSLRLFLSDLMLHFVREAAATCPQISQIFSGMHKGGNGLDGFYLLRGGRVVRKPAIMQINPVASLFLKFCMPRKYIKLAGHSQVEREGARARKQSLNKCSI